MAIACISCNKRQSAIEFKTSDWLVGRWQIEDDFKAYEIWKKQDDSALTGSTVYYQGMDSSILETLVLSQKKGKVVYEATVVNQNDGRGIPFNCVALNADSMRFENLGHEFPKVIRYIRRGDDSLTAYAEGQVDSAWKVAEYKMHRLR